MSERAFAPIYEISSENKIAGRRPIKVVLHEIFPDNTRWQENGISWKEEYVQANLHSVVGMSIVAEFLTEDRDVPYNHGMTDVREEDKLPLFEDATMVGHFDKAYVDDVEIGGVTKRCLVAEGTLDEMRYPKFVAWLRENMADSVVKGSVEIVGKPEHDGYIIYSGGWKEEGRVPQYYDYSGYAILSVKPADEAAIVMELNNKKLDKEDGTMDEKTKNELMAAVTGAVSEVNSKWEEYWAKVDTLLAEIKTIGYYKNVQNVGDVNAAVDLKVGMGVVLNRAARTANLPASEEEAKACFRIVSNINDKPEMRNFEETLTVKAGEKVRADDLTTVANLEMEFASYEISTDYAGISVGDKLVFGTDGLLAKSTDVTGYKVYFEVTKKTAYMGKGVLVVVRVQ